MHCVAFCVKILIISFSEGGTTGDESENKPRVPGEWDQQLSEFQKLIFIKAFREERVS